MNGRNCLLVGMLALWPCAFACAQDSDPKPKPQVPAAADDDFGPPVPPLRDDRVPADRRDFNRRGPQGGDRPGGPLREGPRGPGRFDQPGPVDGPPGGNPRGPLGRPMGPQGPGSPRWPHTDWGSLEQNDPEMFKLIQADLNLERQSQELAMQYRQAPEEQREAIKKKLETTVTEHFEARQQRRLLELKRLEEELKRLRESIDKRKEAQQQIVTRRVSELLGVSDEPEF